MVRKRRRGRTGARGLGRCDAKAGPQDRAPVPNPGAVPEQLAVGQELGVRGVVGGVFGPDLKAVEEGSRRSRDGSENGSRRSRKGSENSGRR